MPPSSPRVSVLVPTRGRAAWCEEAVRSALAQEGVDLEVVVSLDGPDPDARARLEGLADPRVRIVEANAPVGRSAARNAALVAARGDLVAFLDDDDLCLPRSLERRVAALDAHPEAVLAHGVARPMDAAGVPHAPLATERRDASARVEDGLRRQLRGRSLLPSTVMARRGAVLEAGGFDDTLSTGEDWLLFLRLASRGPFVAVAAPVVLYRRHGAQVRWDPLQQERALPAFLSRYFDDPACPARARAQRGRLEARLLAFIARNHRRLGRRADASRCLRAAVAKDPRLLLHPRRLRHWLAALFRSPSAAPSA